MSWDGTVMPCCMVMGDDRVALGNLGSASIGEIWTGEQFHRPAICRIMGNDGSLD